MKFLEHTWKYIKQNYIAIFLIGVSIYLLVFDSLAFIVHGGIAVFAFLYLTMKNIHLNSIVRSLLDHQIEYDTKRVKVRDKHYEILAKKQGKTVTGFTKK